ncbi:ATP-binding cassette domain-containing protein [Nonomuraea sp. NPDC003560]
MARLDVAGLTYVLPDGRTLLDSVSFQLGPGITAGLVGPAGSGKSLLLRLIARELRPAAGRISTEGAIGYLPQERGATSGRRQAALETLLRGSHELLLLDEPDDHLDVSGKERLEDQLRGSAKTVLLVSRDRQLLANAANRIIFLDQGRLGTHGGGYATYSGSRCPRPAGAGAAELGGEHAFTCRRLRFAGLTAPFDLRVRFGERVALLGSDDAGRAVFLSLLADPPGPGQAAAPYRGILDVHPRARAMRLDHRWPGPGLKGRSVAGIVMDQRRCGREEAMALLTRYGISREWMRPYETLRTAQRRALRILLAEVEGVNLLLLSDPTGDLDVPGAETVQHAVRGFPGAVVASTCDRWLTAEFPRLLHFCADGRVREPGAGARC